MHKLFVAFLLVAASAASGQRVTADPGLAKLPGPQLRLGDSSRIDPRAAKLEPPYTVFPGPRGGLLVYSQRRTVTFFDSLGRRQWSKGSGNTSRDIGEVTAFGWKGNDLWVSDPAFAQIALLDQYGNVTESIELPDWVRPTFSNRKTFPVFESMRVYARYDDGSMLVIPRGTISITGATGYDENASYVLKINEDGIIQGTVAKLPSTNLTAQGPRGEKVVFANPLSSWSVRISPDGMRTVVVTVDTSAAGTDTIVVRALGQRGDTVYSRKFAYPALVYTDAQIDSIARARYGNDTEYRERRAKVLPRRAPAVVDVALDPNRGVWLTFRGNGSTRAVLGLDAAGRPIGKLLVPAQRSVKVANGGAIWLGETTPTPRGDFVRFRPGPGK